MAVRAIILIWELVPHDILTDSHVSHMALILLLNVNFKIYRGIR